MVKKLICVITVFIFALAFTMSTQLLAQEEEKVEDVMDISLEDLLDVEITTAGKQAEKVSEVPASVVVVSREDIEKYGYQSLDEVMENIPGLYYINDYSYESFGVRGFWGVEPNRNITVLVNDIKMTDDLTTSNYLQEINIPVEAIDRIEVVRGPMSVIYGTGAFFGAINIKTNMVDEKTSSSMASASAGSEKSYRLFARSAGTEGKFQYSLNASYSDTDGINVPMADIDKVGWTTLTETKSLFENAAKYFNFSGKFKGFLFDAMYTESFKDIMILIPPVQGGTSTTNRSVRVSFGYDKEFSDKVRFVAKIGYFLNRMDYNIDFLAEDFYGVQVNGASGYQAELSLFVNPTPKLNFLFGVDYRNVQDVRNDYSFPMLGLDNVFFNLAEGESMVTQAVFAQFNWKLTNNLKLVAGARLEQTPEYTIANKVGISDPADPSFGLYQTTESTYSFTDPQIIPRVALVWGINDKNYIKLLYGKAINRPSFFQITDTAFLPGIPALEPESIQTFEFNYLGTWSANFSASMSAFYNILDKLIFRSLFLVGGELIGPYANVGKMKTTGVELTLNIRPFENFIMELSGTYQDTKDDRPGFEDIEPGYSPKLLGYIKASLFLNKDISLAVNGTYVDEMQSYYDDTLDPPSRLGEKVDAYFLLGANLRIRNMFGTGLFLNVRGSNLLDQEVRYPTTSNNSLYALDGTLGRGVSFMVTLGYKFIPIPRP